MFTGTHVLLYSTNAEADRAFLRDTLGLRFVDVGGGWLIFGLPPAELGVHPGDGSFVQQHGGEQQMGAVVYLMCDDVRAVMKQLEARGVAFGTVLEEQWGISTSIRLPSGGFIGLYQPKHPTALNLK